ncbi:hypothetical protein HFP15_31125 [Amycolatopsis sp. K13G38]|uniref:Uncharacterized protein n=1 Tax=Amycolatopsis acididurans TaxID=2724524 RepID=A0ABX1JC09_9PSEU|nr:hypothetical protein [Amycolatopsis acididurans]NKQ57328.1 hypothetical protein [Amycolatopsis acididurans]
MHTTTLHNGHDGHHEWATVDLPDGRSLDVYASGTVQVYYPDKTAVEFTMPATATEAFEPGWIGHHVHRLG